MIEIAKSCNVPFTPDENVMREDEVAAAEAMLIDFQQAGQVVDMALSYDIFSLSCFQFQTEWIEWTVTYFVLN